MDLNSAFRKYIEFLHGAGPPLNTPMTHQEFGNALSRMSDSGRDRFLETLEKGFKHKFEQNKNDLLAIVNSTEVTQKAA